MGDAPGGVPAEAESLFNQGLDAHDRGELDQAQEHYLGAIQRDPSMVVAYNNLGMVYIDNGMFDEAVDVLQKTLQLDPTYAEAYNNLGFVHRRKGENLAAAECYDKFLELEPAVEDAPKIRAWLEKVRASAPAEPPPAEVPRQAEGLAEISAATGPAVARPQARESPQAVIARAYQYFDEEGYDQALSEFRKAVALAPQDGAAHAGLGRTLARLAQYDEAVLELQKAALFNPSDALNYYALGKSLSELGRNDEAANSYEKFLELMPEAEDAGQIRAWIDEVRGGAAPEGPSPADEFCHRALTEFQDGDLDAALASCEEALSADEYHFQANLLLGRILLRKKDHLRAVAVLRHTSELRPENAEPYFFLGQAYEKRGLHEEARQAYEKCLEVAPDGPQAARVNEWLQRAKEAGKTALGLRCEYCFRSFSEEELSFHEGKRICKECVANLGVAPAEAEGWQSAVAFAPSEALAEEEGVGALGWALRLAGALVCLVILCFLIFLTSAWTGILGPEKLERWGVSPALKAFGLDGLFGKLGVRLHTTEQPPQGQGSELPPRPVRRSVEFETRPPKKALPLIEYVYQARALGAQPVSYSLDLGPRGAKIDPVTGRFSWVPEELGTSSVEISARAGGSEGVQKFDIEVTFPVEPDESMTISLTPGERHFILSADLAGDGLEDIVVCGPGGVTVFRQTQVRTLESTRLEGELVLPIAAAAADIDGDGALELLVADWYSSKIFCWEWDGRDNFTTKFAIETLRSLDALAAGRLDGDDIDDFVAAGWGAGAVQVFTGSKEGLPKEAQRVSCGDGAGMNLMAVVASPLGDRAVLLPGMAQNYEARVFGKASGRETLGKFRAGAAFDGKPIAAVVGNFGAEKQLALLFGGEDGRLVLMGFDDAGTSYEKKETLLLDAQPLSLAAGDMNGDGADDLVVVYPGKLVVFLRRPPDGFISAAEVEVTGAWGPACCADLDGDGRKDIVVICFNRTFRIVYAGRLED